MENRKESAVEWAASVPVAPKTSIIAQSDKPVELAENNLAVKGNRLTGNTPDGKKNVAIDLSPDNRFNKLSVPAGGGYRLTLEDGTTIQLNAASELLFPTHFKKHIRQVKLKGEACFKVKSNPESPFYVLLGMLNVEVTGTTFNIKAYETGETTRITLLEGRVQRTQRAGDTRHAVARRTVRLPANIAHIRHNPGRPAGNHRLDGREVRFPQRDNKQYHGRAIPVV